MGLWNLKLSHRARVVLSSQFVPGALLGLNILVFIANVTQFDDQQGLRAAASELAKFGFAGGVIALGIAGTLSFALGLLAKWVGFRLCWVGGRVGKPEARTPFPDRLRWILGALDAVHEDRRAQLFDLVESWDRAFGARNLARVLELHPALATALSDQRLKEGPRLDGEYEADPLTGRPAYSSKDEGRTQVGDHDSFRGHAFAYAKSWLRSNGIESDGVNDEIMINASFGLVLPVLVSPFAFLPGVAESGGVLAWTAWTVSVVVVVLMARLLVHNGQALQQKEHALVLRDFFFENWYRLSAHAAGESFGLDSGPAGKGAGYESSERDKS